MTTPLDFEAHLRAQNLSERTIASYLWTTAYFTSHYESVSKANLLAYKGYLLEAYKPKTVNLRIGEFGSRAKGDNSQARIEHAAYYVATARVNGITCFWWDNNAFTGNGELFGLFDRAKLAWKPREILDAMLRYAE